MTDAELKAWAEHKAVEQWGWGDVERAVLTLIRERDVLIRQVDAMTEANEEWDEKAETLARALENILEASEGERLPFKGTLWMKLVDARPVLAAWRKG